MISYEHQVALAEERRQRLLEEAQTQQMVNRQENSTGPATQLMASLGDLLIAGGTKLKERAQMAETGWPANAQLLREADR